MRPPAFLLAGIALLGTAAGAIGAPSSLDLVRSGSVATSDAETLASSVTVISSNSTLSHDLYAVNLVINPGITLRTDGFYIIVKGTFDNRGLVTAGYGPSQNYPRSYGGSGGGGFSHAFPNRTQDGRFTLAPGGEENTSNVLSNQTAWAGNGSTPAPPTLNRSVLVRWLFGNLYLRIEGGAGGEIVSYVSPGEGANGVYIQARTLIAGNISAAGAAGGGTCSGIGLSGGGGGGVILLAYGLGGLTSGRYNVTGGAGAPSCAGNVHSGHGGAGSVLTVSYGAYRPI